MKKAKVISILNHKGGVGKTTTTSALLAGLSNLGKRTLAIDIDGQANLTISLGLEGSEANNAYTALKNGKELIVHQTTQGYHIVPASLDLQAAEIELSAKPGRELILKRLLKDSIYKYDYILIDCPPSLGLLTLNALTASNGIIIPVEAETLALQGMSKLLSVIEEVRSILNADLKIEGILITKYDSRKILNKTVLKVIEQNYPNEVFKTIIRDNVALAEAPLRKQDIYSYAQKSMGAQDYMNLCEEIISKERKDE